MSYDLFLSTGEILTTVATKTVDTRLHSSLVLIGAGVPDLWSAIGQDFTWMLENFSRSEPPTNPLIGQNWHSRAHGRMSFYDGQKWRDFVMPETTDKALFGMLETANDIDFAHTGGVPIFTAPDSHRAYCATLLLLIPHGTITATTSPTINLSSISEGDVLSSTEIPIETVDQCIRLPTNQCARMVLGTSPISFYSIGLYGAGAYSSGAGQGAIWLNITTAATGGDIRYDARLFGFTVIPN